MGWRGGRGFVCSLIIGEVGGPGGGVGVLLIPFIKYFQYL